MRPWLRTKKLVIDRSALWPALALFKLNWLLLVLWPVAGVWWCLCLLLPLQLAWMTYSSKGPRLRNLQHCLLFAAVGCLLDQTLTFAGVFAFSTALIPAWLVLLWCSFALALLALTPLLLRWPTWWCSTVMMLGGVLGYGAGHWLGAVRFGLPWPLTLLVVALCWSLLWLPWRWVIHQRISPQRPLTWLALLLVLGPGQLHPVQAADASWQTLGRARFSVLLLPIFDATLQAPDRDFRFPDSAPFTLTLEYRRDIKASAILTSTIDQWRQQHVSWQPAWQRLLQESLPDVRRGDRLRLDVHQDHSGTLLHNNQPVADYTDSTFVVAFAGIWLDASTTHPNFRRQLLGETP